MFTVVQEGNSAGSDYPHRVPRGEMPWRCRVAVLNVTCTCSILNQNWTLVPSYCFQGISDPGNAKIHVFSGGVEEDDWTQAEEATLFRRDDLNVSMLRLDKPFVFDSSNVSVFIIFSLSSHLFSKCKRSECNNINFWNSRWAALACITTCPMRTSSTGTRMGQDLDATMSPTALPYGEWNCLLVRKKNALRITVPLLQILGAVHMSIKAALLVRMNEFVP